MTEVEPVSARVAVDGVFREVLNEIDDTATRQKSPSRRPLKVYEIEHLEQLKREEEEYNAKRAREEKKKQFIAATEALRQGKTGTTVTVTSGSTGITKRQIIEGEVAHEISETSTPTESEHTPSTNPLLAGLQFDSEGVYMGSTENLSPEVLDAIRKHYEITQGLARHKREAAERRKRARQRELKRLEQMRIEQEHEMAMRTKYEEEKKQERLMERMNAQARRQAEAQERQQKLNELRALERQDQRLKEKPLYERLQENFESKILMPEPEKRKRQLQALHDQFKPMDLADIKAKGERNVQIAQELEKQKFIEREQQRQAMPVYVKVPKTKTSEKIAQEMRELRDQVHLTKQEKIALVNRRGRYAAMVKEMFPPTVAVESPPPDPVPAPAGHRVTRPPRRLPQIPERQSRSHDESQPTSSTLAVPEKPVRAQSLMKPRRKISNAEKEKKKATKGADEKRLDVLVQKAMDLDMKAQQKADDFQKKGEVPLDDLEKAVEHQAQISTMYIDAIKAKLEILQEVDAQTSAQQQREEGQPQEPEHPEHYPEEQPEQKEPEPTSLYHSASSEKVASPST